MQIEKNLDNEIGDLALSAHGKPLTDRVQFH